MRRGMLSFDRIAVAATASGGDTMAPNASATAQGISGTRNLTVAAITSMVTITRPIASRPIGRRFALKSPHRGGGPPLLGDGWQQDPDKILGTDRRRGHPGDEAERAADPV